MKKLILLSCALIAPSLAHAQTSEDVATYLAFVRTPAGGLAPMLTNTILNRAQNGASLGLRYGNVGRGTFNNTSHAFAVTGILPAGLDASFRLTAGALFLDDGPAVLGGDDPPARLMLGAGGDMRIMSSPMGPTDRSPLFTLSIDGEIGYANADPGSFVSGYVGAPLALVSRGNGLQIAPFITPGFVIGQASANGTSTSGAGFVVGGGIGIYNVESSVIINAGAQYSFVRDAKTSVGINIIFGGR